jgi:tetratricopeptide (TPR) repeat protein
MSIVGLALLAPLASLALGVGGEDAAAKPSPRATETLTAAAKLKREASGKKGEEKLEALLKAARGYERAMRELADEKPAAAEAAFRAGEIWRTLRHEEDATRCFTAAANETGAPTVAAKAWLELGHVERRQKRFAEARRCYDRVLMVTPEQRRESARALTWQGKVLLEQKNDPDGHATLLAVGQRFPEFPLDDIRNVDTVAVDWFEAGRVAEARALVDDCVERHSEPDDGEEEVEPSVRRALEKMRARELLQQAASK